MAADEKVPPSGRGSEGKGRWEPHPELVAALEARALALAADARARRLARNADGGDGDGG